MKCRLEIQQQQHPRLCRFLLQPTRTHYLGYIQLHTNCEQYKNSFLPRTIREWNALPPDIVHAASADEFAARLQNAESHIDIDIEDLFYVEYTYIK